MIAHFIVNGVEGCMIAICGAVIAPKDTKGAMVGIRSERVCEACKDKVANAWATVKG